MRATAPIAFVPELGATLFCKRDQIFAQEKRIHIFSSHQPEGLMTTLMGQNLMRKDGPAHADERKALFPTFSPRTVRDHWREMFEQETVGILDRLAPLGTAELVAGFAMETSARALCHVTGLTNMDWQEIDRTSQGMIDGISNYQADPEIRAGCDDCTASIDRHIEDRIPQLLQKPDLSLLSVQLAAGLPMDSVRANIKLAISGGQNEPRDVLAGLVWALLKHPEQLALVLAGTASWANAFSEYTRWISPIGMSPRRIAETDTIDGITLAADSLVFFMYGSGNRDEDVFERAEQFDVTRDCSASLAFGAGPHFCAGAAIARSLITEVALPMLFDCLANLHLTGPVPFTGWAFRGPVSVPVAWDTSPNSS